MYCLYQKNELNFSLVWIAAYVASFSIADNVSASLGMQKIITAPVSVLFAGFMLVFIKRHHLENKYGLCSFKGNGKDFLYFIPLILIMSVNGWNGIGRNGIARNVSIAEMALFMLSMACAGVIEEVLFRGFLFKAMCSIHDTRDNVKAAVFISSMTFGMGHVVNLLNGKDPIPTLLQTGYAAAIGFLFTIIFYKGKSLVPCMITHGIFNALSIFAVKNNSLMDDVTTAALLSVISIAYALWILRETKKSEKVKN